jgi:acetyltransferase-like isoleucine patch superfamily enzyme
MTVKIHPTAEVQSPHIGEGTVVWQNTVVLEGATVGADCNLNCFCFVENDVRIGNRVTVKSGVSLWDGMTAEDEVFIGPNATFTNHKDPRSKTPPPEFDRIVLKKGCSVGANATVIGPCIIGANALVAAGAVVTKDVPDNAVVAGNPARILRQR